MQFLDRARILVRAGDGGNGVTAFRREKFVPRGGPSGGDGGRGGQADMEATDGLNTLLHFRFNPRYVAERGRHGEGKNCHGRDGEDLLILVPVGTLREVEASVAANTPSRLKSIQATSVAGPPVWFTTVIGTV